MSDLPQVLTIGRISVDLYGREIGAGLDRPQTFAKAVGGSPTNVAIGLAKYGHRSAVLTGVGDDSLGTFLINGLAHFGVNTTFVRRVPGGRTPIVIAGTESPDSPEFIFYRDSNAPDTQIGFLPDEISKLIANDVELLWYTGSNFAVEPLRSTVLDLLEKRARKRHTIFDLDYRPSFWSNSSHAHHEINAGLHHATVAIGNLAECRVATGLGDDASAEHLADALLTSGVEVAIVKGGRDGVLVADHEDREFVAGLTVETVCGLGAGDGFGAGFAHGLLSGWSANASVTFANAAGAIVAAQLLCSEAMPREDEVFALLAKNGIRLNA